MGKPENFGDVFAFGPNFPGGLREEVLAARTPSWSFVVELSDSESVQLEGVEQTAELSPDLIALSAILRRTFQRGLREWKQPALS